MLMSNRASICEEIVEKHRQRQDLHRAEKALTLRIKAVCRRLCEGDKNEAERLYKNAMSTCDDDDAAAVVFHAAPMLRARSLLEPERKAIEKQMAALAKGLPVYAWVESVRGLNALGLASIIGETGDLSNYPTVPKVWKRLGLAVINGERQQRKADKELAILHGYSPSRRSVVWVQGDTLIRHGGYYADRYRAHKGSEQAKAEGEGLTVAPAASIPKAKTHAYRSVGHIHNRAKRKMEKDLIEDLWRAWRDTG